MVLTADESIELTKINKEIKDSGKLVKNWMKDNPTKGKRRRRLMAKKSPSYGKSRKAPKAATEEDIPKFIKKIKESSQKDLALRRLKSLASRASRNKIKSRKR